MNGCAQVELDARRAHGQARRDFAYAFIVIVTFVLGIAMVVGAVAVAESILQALLRFA